MNQIQTLLDKIGVIRYKQEILDSKRPYNVFDVLRLKSDEVRLHSRFIGDLLNPEGMHGLGAKTLEAFLQQINYPDFKYEGIQVTVEWMRIDLLIRNNHNQAIIIENKIYASDSEAQLERYQEKVKGLGFSNIAIYYLSLNGKAPTEGLGNLILEDIGLLSYENHIYAWISRCMELAVDKPELRETLSQYKDLIESLTQNTMDKELKDELISLISQGDNMANAKLIAHNWVHMQYYTEAAFWSDFEKLIGDEYKILENQKWSYKKLDETFHTRKKNWYGLMFKIADWNEYDVCLFIERSADEGSIYYGITVLRNGERSEELHQLAKELSDALSDLMHWKPTHVWFGGRYFQPDINFNSFADQTPKLANPENRASYLANYWAQIKVFIEQSQTIITNMKND